ncbi:type II secretion system major pseudopilin GspG [Ponticaulis sp.]|uniref:type II secretion system major pseudopilin GspG n=1 Tax=Ponticaulis sp. TaxID=2020902 RepID=UPI000B74540A|nr:type II secretion system major pseudopilin GspG [Ponticaulis sp.]MAI89693.1 type II secretion system protein GspG [Ponticaulis sp.]OUY00711.1 MAG: type II secretion system protein GspG [Hyphomonadaceae bacterium TMED5]|tara:strand:+ start:98591 stop:99067 length:477 start_codon:yes stop_codon:yes gene_type:complete
MKALISFLTRKRAKRLRGDEGFSLTEIMVAVFIMGLLATVVMINVLPSRDRAMVQKARTDILALETALYEYNSDMLEFPSSQQGLEALVEVPNGVNREEMYRDGGYLLRRQIPEDPWGNPYQYRYPGENGRIDVYSLGADGRPGGEDLNADIGNWGAE